MKKSVLDNRDRVRQYYIDNHDRLNTYQKNYNYEKSEKTISYFGNRIKTDVSFRLIRNTRRRNHHALKGKTKSPSTQEILGVDIDTYKKWIEFQFTPEKKWSSIEIDHVKPICKFDVTKVGELKEAFSCRSAQPLLKHAHQLKGTKFNFLYYQLQFIKGYQFIRLNEERFNADLR